MRKRFIDKIVQIFFSQLHVTICIMSYQKVDYNVVFVQRDDLEINGMIVFALHVYIMSGFQELCSFRA